MTPETERTHRAFKQYARFRAALRWRAFSTHKNRKGAIEMASTGGGYARTAAAAFREKVEFPVDEQVFLTLDYDNGKIAQGRGGDQYQYTFDGSTRIAWFDPDVHALIVASGARKGDEIAITRRQERGEDRKLHSVWEVEKVDDSDAREPEPAAAAQPTWDDLQASKKVPMVERGRPPAPAPAAPAAPTARRPQPSKDEATAPRSPSNRANPEGVAHVARLMADAIAAAAMSISLAEAEGVPVKFKPEDVRSLAITIFIQQGGGR